MKSPILGLRTTIYKVPDLASAKEWYTKAFQKEPYFDQPFYVGFNIGGFELGLLPVASPDDEKGGSVIAYWGVEDIQAEYNRFIILGAASQNPPNNVGDPIIVAEVKDPWGNIIGLIYNPVFKQE